MNKELLPYDREQLSPEALERMIGSARAKAGIDMNKINISGTARRRIGKRTAAAAAIIFAAALLTLPVSAVYTQFTHKAAVMGYFSEDTAKYLEDKGLALNHVGENEHLRVTVDTLLSDGHIGNLILTIDGLDEKGSEYVGKKPFPHIFISEKGSDEKVMFSGGGSLNEQQMNSVNSYSLRMDLQLHELFESEDYSPDKSYVITFAEEVMRPQDENDADKGYTVSYDEGLFEGIAIEADLGANVEVKELCDETGEKVYLSQIGYYSEGKGVMNKVRNYNIEVRLQRKDSIFSDKADTESSLHTWYDPEQAPFAPLDKGSPTAHPVVCGWFDSMRDIKEYDGVRIANTNYSETE